MHSCLCNSKTTKSKVHSWTKWQKVKNTVASDLKNERMISVRFQDKPFNITVIQVYATTSDIEKADIEWFYEDLKRPSRTNTPKRCTFHHRGLKCKSRKSRDTGVTGKFGLRVQNEARQRLGEFYQQSALVKANSLFQQHKRRLYTWTSPDGQQRNQIDYILCSQR